MPIRKAVIPVAGWGTRFLPVTKAVPKELLPIIDRPVIQFAIDEAAAAGITQVILVTSESKRSIEGYFERAPGLEAFLERRGDARRLQQVKALQPSVEIRAVVQQEQLGLGHAVLTARALVGDEPFAVLLPDDVIEASTPAIGQLIKLHEQRRCSVLAVQPVAREEVERYGVIAGDRVAPGTYRVTRVVEKPRPGEAPSDLAIIGRYILTPEIFRRLERVQPGAIGEIQLTDGIAALLEEQEVCAYEYEGKLHDAGTPLGLLKASVEAALKRPDTGRDLRGWLRDLLALDG